MKKNLNKLATLALTGILMTGMSFGALADAATLDGGKVKSRETSLQIVKDLGVVDVDSDYVPTAPVVKFTYSIAAASGDQLGVVGGDDSTPRKAGLYTNKVNLGEASFTTSSTVTNKKATQNVTIDFSGITEDDWGTANAGAGVYRYVLTETSTYKVGNNGYDYSNAVKKNTEETRYIDVYVGYYTESGTEKLGIIGYVVRETTDGETKTNGYVIDNVDETSGSVYKTYDLKVNKKVTGTLGDRNKDFNFTTAVVVPAGATYGYTETNNNEKSSITSAEVSVASTLKDSENFEIKGVPYGQELTVVEDNYTSAGYKTYVAIDSENYGSAFGDNAERTSGAQKENEQNNVATVVNFKNEKNETTPTGVVMNIAPYAAMILGAGAFAGVFLGRKKSEDEE